MPTCTGRSCAAGSILVRTGGTGSDQWLLMHKHDENAVQGWNPEDHPESVLSGRTNDEVKADPERVWRSDLPPSEASVAVRRSPAPPSGHQDRPAPGPSPDELAALDTLGSGGTWDVFGRSVRLTNLDKVLFPARADEPPVTKRELVRYTAQIAPVALPYLKDRALNMHRFPGGADTKGFWHKQLPDHAPEWLPRWDDPHAEPGETTTYLVVDEPAALVWAANFGALEWHAWTARTDHPDRPSYALDRHRSRAGDHLGPGADAGPAAPHRPGPPRGPRATQADRRPRDPYLDPDRARDPASRRPGPGWSSCPGRSARWCPSR